jgi:hypothetical protein
VSLREERAAPLCALGNETFAGQWGRCPLLPEASALFVVDGGEPDGRA